VEAKERRANVGVTGNRLAGNDIAAQRDSLKEGVCGRGHNEEPFLDDSLEVG